MSNEFRKELGDAKWFEYRLKGLEEGYWRSIGYRDAQSVRDAADLMWSTLHELADLIEDGGPHS